MEQQHTRSLFDMPILKRAVIDAFRKLDPREMVRNPVMFVVEVGAVMTTVIVIGNILSGGSDSLGFNLQIALWLWFTVLFANFAEAMAEGRGKAQADALRKTRTQMMARRLKGGIAGTEETVPATDLKKGDLVVCEAGDQIPGDGEVI